MHSHLARHQPEPPADDDQLHRMRSAAWHRQGIAVIRLEDVHDDWTRQVIANAAAKLYGKRKDKACDEHN